MLGLDPLHLICKPIIWVLWVKPPCLIQKLDVDGCAIPLKVVVGRWLGITQGWFLWNFLSSALPCIATLWDPFLLLCTCHIGWVRFIPLCHFMKWCPNVFTKWSNKIPSLLACSFCFPCSFLLFMSLQYRILDFFFTLLVFFMRLLPSFLSLYGEGFSFPGLAGKNSLSQPQNFGIDVLFFHTDSTFPFFINM